MRRWWKQHDTVVLGKKRDGALCGQGQFLCSVTGLHLLYLDHQLECLPQDSMGSIHMVWEHLKLDSCRWDLPPTSSPYMTGHMPLVRKKMGDRETLRYWQWDRSKSRRHGWQMKVQWKELLAWVAAGEDDQVEDDQVAELHFYFLGDKKFFDGRGNVESHRTGGSLLEEQTGLTCGTQVGRATSDPTRSTQASPTRWVGTFGLDWCT